MSGADHLVPPGAVGAVLVAATGDARWAHPTATLLSGGKSNLTYALDSPAGTLVLRRPPSGDLLPTAHDMAREARVQRALAPTPVPVPRIVAVDDGEAFGVPFYVMERVAGHVVRGELPPGALTEPADRHRLGLRLADLLADLHAVDPEAVGLGDFGRPTGFLDRQVSRWRRQWAASRDDDVPAVDALAGVLAASVPESPPAAVVHGDLRLDNCVVGDDGTVRAVLDWEMSTLGDPLTDVGLLAFYWRDPGEPQRSLIPGVTDRPGFPTRAEVLQRYATRAGRPVDDLHWYLGFAHFKFAVITQGIAARVRDGAMAGQDFGDLRDEVRTIAADGLAMMD
ncbi:phosphotransferase family protein [Jatrophihabitans sp. YIM 134969]